MVRAPNSRTKWRCGFANDFDHKKSAIYRRNWGDGALKTADMRTFEHKGFAERDGPSRMGVLTMPGPFACGWRQAGCRKVTGQERSGRLEPDEIPHCRKLAAPGHYRAGKCLRHPYIAQAVRTSRRYARTFANKEPRLGRLQAVHRSRTAALFVPQSRPRLFILGVRTGLAIPGGLTQAAPSRAWGTRAGSEPPLKWRPRMFAGIGCGGGCRRPGAQLALCPFNRGQPR